MEREAVREVGMVPSDVTYIGQMPSHMAGTWHSAKSHDVLWQLAKFVT